MNKDKKNVCIGLLAHVDAGKTTLSDFFQAGSFFVGGYAGDVVGYAGAY